MVTKQRQFGYLGDPVCAGSLAIYLCYRFILRPHGWQTEFMHCYLNDILCLPLFVPIILAAQHLVGLRPHFGPPRKWEIIQCWLVFSVLFDVILPQFPRAFHTTSDPCDVVAYLAGGVFGAALWRTINVGQLIRRIFMRQPRFSAPDGTTPPPHGHFANGASRFQK